MAREIESYRGARRNDCLRPLTGTKGVWGTTSIRNPRDYSVARKHQPVQRRGNPYPYGSLRQGFRPSGIAGIVGLGRA